jgi:hypothetical protein
MCIALPRTCSYVPKTYRQHKQKHEYIHTYRYRYYYGRETLFKTHPDLVENIAKSMPALLENLLDGLLWHAQMVRLYMYVTTHSQTCM